MAPPPRDGQSPEPKLLWAPTSAGELLDKLTILELKEQRLRNPHAVANAAHERQLLLQVQQRAGLNAQPRLSPLLERLRRVNSALWDTEDALRECERRGDFGDDFVEMARSVYRHNDERAGIKRAINELLGSSLLEEKSHGDARDSC